MWPITTDAGLLTLRRREIEIRLVRCERREREREREREKRFDLLLKFRKPLKFLTF